MLEIETPVLDHLPVFESSKFHVWRLLYANAKRGSRVRTDQRVALFSREGEREPLSRTAR